MGMDRNYHVFSDGKLERKDDTLRVVTEDGEKKYVPVEQAEAVYLHGQIDYNTRLISFLNKHGTAVHVFGWEDHYAGSVMPEKGQKSGRTVVEQVRAYDDTEQRIGIAQSMVEGSIHNMRRNVMYYDNRGHDFSDVIRRMEELSDEVHRVSSTEEVMGVEASARRSYYSTFDDILKEEFRFRERKYNPPTNEVNSLISYGNSLVYANCVSAIRATALEPSVSYLHEPGERRYSLALDIADLFKPILTDRVIFRLVNRGQISEQNFEEEMNACLLNDKGRKLFTKEFEETLEKTVEHPNLDRKVSYQYLLRLEAYKLKKHLLTGEKYKPFKRWW
jgi:CRISPR-associated protein Cas1